MTCHLPAMCKPDFFLLLSTTAESTDTVLYSAEEQEVCSTEAFTHKLQALCFSYNYEIMTISTFSLRPY